MGNRIEIIGDYPNGYWIKYEYDSNNNLIYREDSDGNITDNRNLSEAKLNKIPIGSVIEVKKFGPVTVTATKLKDSEGDKDLKFKNKIKLTYEIDGFIRTEDSPVTEEWVSILNQYWDEIEQYFENKGYTLWSY